MAKRTPPTKEEAGSRGLSPLYEFDAQLRALVPGLMRAMQGQGDDFGELRVKCRGYGDWLAIAKRFGDDGTPEVCFASGVDFSSAVMAVDRAIRAGKWKPEKPWAPSK